MTPEISSPPEPPEVTWGYTDLLLFTFLSILSIFVSQITVHGVALLFHRQTHDNPALLLPTQLLLYAILCGVLCAIIKLQYGRGFWKSLAWTESAFSLGAATLLGFVLALAMTLAASLLRTPDVDSPMKHLLAHRTTALEFALLGTTLGPLCEELIFRGFMQPVLVRSLGPPIGIFVTAAVFGALHLAQYGFAWQAGTLITLAGMAFGWMRQLTGSTRVSTWMHAGYNSCVFVILFASGPQFQ